jgi:hypothetical protein
MLANGTAVVVGCVTCAANRPVICPVRPGNCPGSKLVRRSICKVGCGWLRYRVTMMQGFERLKCYCQMSLVLRRCCKYCDEQLTTTDRVMVSSFNNHFILIMYLVWCAIFSNIFASDSLKKK